MRQLAPILLFIILATSCKKDFVAINTDPDLITASQAFHWFDVHKSRSELARVLRPRGWVALIWNERPLEAMPLLDEYDALLRRHAPLVLDDLA